jgi:hypothetical protein
LRSFSKLACIVLIISIFSSCASIVSRSNWPFSVETSPEHATVVITNKKGNEVFRGKTPAAMKLRSGSGFFSKESYVVSLSMNGYETKKISLECKVNGWYFGNVILGGFIGMLIVDPATGAMYKLDNDGIYQELEKNKSTTELKIIDLQNVPDSLKANLVKL